MQAGFAVVSMGLCRAKNAAHTISMSLMIGPLSAVAFWTYGFALAWGNADASPVPAGWRATLGPQAPILDRGLGFGLATERPEVLRYPLLGWKGFFLSGMTEDGVLAWFFWTLVLSATVAAIPLGSLAERWRWRSFCWYGLWAALPCALAVNWVWGGGLLAASGINWHLGHGVVDFAGSGVIHATGGMIALAGATVLGPRIGKYTNGKPGKKPRPVPFPAHYLPMVVLGTLILTLGWIGLNAGWVSVSSDVQLGAVAVNSLLAATAGGLAAMTVLSAKRMKPEPSMPCGGILAGLVAISASCAFVDTWAAVLIGGFAGVLVVLSVMFWERRGVDDPAGAISTHGICGIWGTIALGIFADGRCGAGWNGVARDGFRLQYGSDAVRGLLYGDTSQLLAQVVGATALAVSGFVVATILFRLSAKIVPMRVSVETEYEGLDVPEMGARGYPDFSLTRRG